MSKDVLLAVAIGGAVLLVLQKQAQAKTATTPAKTTSTNPKTVNVADDMWTRLLGAGWLNLPTAQNADGTAAFLKNIWGQITTSDGKPVSAGDPIAAWTQTNASLPVPIDNTDYAAGLFPTLGTGLEDLGWKL